MPACTKLISTVFYRALPSLFFVVVLFLRERDRQREEKAEVTPGPLLAVGLQPAS
jgi:hypothetical protein